MKKVKFNQDIAGLPDGIHHTREFHYKMDGEYIIPAKLADAWIAAGICQFVPDESGSKK